MTSLMLLLLLAGGPPRGGPLLVERAEFVMAPTRTPPPSGSGVSWTRVNLPDRWRERRPQAGGTGWYRFALDPQAFPEEVWGVFLPSVNMNAAVFLNGRLLGMQGAMAGDLGNNWNRPLHFTFPRALLASGPNELAIKVEARAHAFGGLGRVLVGPADVLAARHERHHFLAVTLSLVSTFIAAWLLLWAAAMWLGTRRDPLFGWFALSVLAFACANLNYHVRDLPVPRALWEWLVNFSLDAFAVAALVFVNRLLHRSSPWIERSLAAGLVLGGGLLALAPDRWFYAVAHAVHLLAVCAAALCAWGVVRSLRRLARLEAALVCAGAVLGTGFGLHDFLLQIGVTSQETPRLLPHAISLYVMVFGSVLVARSLRALQACKRHNTELARAVQQREAELARQFELVSQYQRQQVLGQERERIMAEVHDGLGGQLASTLAMAQGPAFSREALVESLRLITEELSLLVDALDPTLDDLGSLLAILRDRIEPRLARAGVRFQWRVADSPLDKRLRPDQLHHVIRIVQEATANVIKHARAHTIVVRTAIERQGILLEIRDDGVGLGPPRSRGRGLRNMQQRARQLGGELTVVAGNPGTAVLLRLPLPARPAPLPVPAPAASSRIVDQSSSRMMPRLTAS